MKVQEKLDLGDEKQITCCFTGHRPSKLPWKNDKSSPGYKDCSTFLRKEIEQSIQEGYKKFIVGMALGIDTLAGEIILELKEKYPFIELECAIPCNNQHKYWESVEADYYTNFLNKADKVTIVNDCPYFEGCMQIRNRYMVKKSSKLIAVYNGTPGGTQSTIKEAKRLGLDVCIYNVSNY